MDIVFKYFRHLVDISSQIADYDGNIHGMDFNDKEFLSAISKKDFPDKVSKGGPLLETKDLKKGTTIMFNSTIPKGRKSINNLSDNILSQLKQSGDLNISERDVYYLARKKRKTFVQVALVHGRFYEVSKNKNPINDLILNTLRNNDKNQIPPEVESYIKSVQIDEDVFGGISGYEEEIIIPRLRFMSESQFDVFKICPKDAFSMILPRIDEERVFSELKDTFGYSVPFFVKEHPCYHDNYFVFYVELK